MVKATDSKRFCRTCNQDKDISRFSKRVQLNQRAYEECYDCKNLKRRTESPEKRAIRLAQRRLKYAESPKKYVDRGYLAKYGKDVAERDALFESQGKVCKICGNDKTTGRGWCTDHDHKTGAVRGILCHNCNLLLGHAKDSQIVLLSAVQYLKEHEDKRKGN